MTDGVFPPLKIIVAVVASAVGVGAGRPLWLARELRSKPPEHGPAALLLLLHLCRKQGTAGLDAWLLWRQTEVRVARCGQVKILRRLLLR